MLRPLLQKEVTNSTPVLTPGPGRRSHSDEKTIGIIYEGNQADMTLGSIPLIELINK